MFLGVKGVYNSKTIEGAARFLHQYTSHLNTRYAILYVMILLPKYQLTHLFVVWNLIHLIYGSSINFISIVYWINR